MIRKSKDAQNVDAHFCSTPKVIAECLYEPLDMYRICSIFVIVELHLYAANSHVLRTTM